MFVLVCLKQWFSELRARYIFYRKFGIVYPSSSIVSRTDAMTIGSDFGISPNCQIFCQDPESGSRVSIGNRVKLNFGVMINADCGGQIHIGDDVLIGPNVVVRAANHNFSNRSLPVVQQGHIAGKIRIEDNVWIGANVVILPDVTIGAGAVIAAGAIVNRTVRPGVLAGGVPARVIRVIQ